MRALTNHQIMRENTPAHATSTTAQAVHSAHTARSLVPARVRASETHLESVRLPIGPPERVL
eukprot:3339920-Prymnesium_polylepis.2